MTFHENCLYHVYNRGNDRQPIFFSRANYLFFLQKIRDSIRPHCEMLAYCLMPNHFHLLLLATESTLKTNLIGGMKKNVLSEGFKSALSSYTQAINRQEVRTGSLFTQNTKAKELPGSDYGCTCFQYIHQNPARAGLVKRLEDWEFSSFRDYAGLRNGTLCNREQAKVLLDLSETRFYEDSYKALKVDVLPGIW